MQIVQRLTPILYTYGCTKQGGWLELVRNWETCNIPELPFTMHVVFVAACVTNKFIFDSPWF